MKPHRWRIGDVLRTTYGYVGTVTDRFTYSVTLDRHLFLSQTLVKEKLSDQEAAREIRHIREDKTAARAEKPRAEGPRTREKLRSRRGEARKPEQLGFGFGDGPARKRR